MAASDGTFPTKVRITWTAVTSATGYQVFRQIAGGAVTQIGTTNATTLAFDDTTIAVGQIGSYTVKATHALGTTAASTADDGFRAPPFDGGIAGDGDGTADGGNGDGGGGSDGGSGDGLDDNIDGDLGDEAEAIGDRPAFDPTNACVAVEARIAGRLASAELVDTSTRAMLESLLVPFEPGGDAADGHAAATTKACAIRAGDVDLDGVVTVSDLVAFLVAWADRDEFRGDVNRDGFVDALDYAEVYLRVAEASRGSDGAGASDGSVSAD